MPVTPLQIELQRSGNILTNSFRDVGQRAIRKEELGLQRDLMSHQLGRQSEMDALQRPGLQVKAEEDTMRLQQLNEPVTLGAMAQDHWGLMHFTSGDDPLVNKIGRMFDAKIDTDQKSPTYGKFVRKDGNFLKNKDLMVKSREVQALILANTDPVETVNDQMGRYLEKLQGLQEGTPEYQTTLNNLKQAAQWLEDPRKQLQTLKDQREALSRLPANAEFDKGIARIDAQIAGIQKQYGELAKEEREHGRAKELEGIKHGHRMKEKGVTTGPKAPQFASKQEEFQFETDKKRYSDLSKALADASKGATDLGFSVAMKPEEKAAIVKEMEVIKKRWGASIELEPKTVVRTGTDPKTGRRVVQYSDGSIEYEEEAPKAKPKPTATKPSPSPKKDKKPTEPQKPLSLLELSEGLGALEAGDTEEAKRVLRSIVDKIKKSSQQAEEETRFRMQGLRK